MQPSPISSSPSPDSPGFSKTEKLFLLSGGLTGLATRMASPQIVLPWVYSLIGGPLILVGLLVPSVRIGALVAQLTIVPTLMARTMRKGAFVVSTILIAVVLLILCLATLQTSIFIAAAMFFVCVFVIGACNGVLTLSSQEVMAKSVKSARIGRVLALQGSIGGLLTLISMGLLFYLQPESESRLQHLVLIFISSGIWLLAGLSFAMIREPPSEPQPKRAVWAEIRTGWDLFQTTPWFRRFFLTRALFLTVGLSTPFYSIRAAMEIDSDTQGLSLAVLATGITSLLSGPIWSRQLSANPCRVLVLAGFLAAGAGLVAVLHRAIGNFPVSYVFMLVFGLLNLAVMGLTQASKAYLAIKSPETDRPRFLAVNNALLGVLSILVSGLLGVLAHTAHIYAALALLIFLALLAGFSAIGLSPPEPEDNLRAEEQ